MCPANGADTWLVVTETCTIIGTRSAFFIVCTDQAGRASIGASSAACFSVRLCVNCERRNVVGGCSLSRGDSVSRGTGVSARTLFDGPFISPSIARTTDRRKGRIGWAPKSPFCPMLARDSDAIRLALHPANIHRNPQRAVPVPTRMAYDLCHVVIPTDVTLVISKG